MDARKKGLKKGLRQLTKKQLEKVLDYNGEMCLDEFNYYQGKFCPLAIAVGLENMSNSTHDKVRTELVGMGFTIDNTRGIEGSFYTKDRLTDLKIAAREVFYET